jgi:tRNA (cmo5U34)-methyltransferase
MSKSLTFYNTRAERYHQRKGFAPERKEKMQQAALDLLTTLAPPHSTILELGAGTGLFTEQLLQANHFREIYVTDGANAMLALAQQNLESEHTTLHFVQLDFTTNWSDQFTHISLDAVTSSMALHHAADKQPLFQQIFTVLKPGGVLVLADHVAGASAGVQRLIDRERALVRLGRTAAPEQIVAAMRKDKEVQTVEGNVCESVAQYQSYLAASGFQDIDCLWRDYWLAVFVAQKPASG